MRLNAIILIKSGLVAQWTVERDPNSAGCFLIDLFEGLAPYLGKSSRLSLEAHNSSTLQNPIPGCIRPRFQAVFVLQASFYFNHATLVFCWL